MVTYKGVHKIDNDCYEARVFKDGRETRIGVYKSDVEAALAYDITVEAALGDFATGLNFPEHSLSDQKTSAGA
jgi:hypothetical protein